MLLGEVEPLHVRVDIDEHDVWRVRPDAPNVSGSYTRQRVSEHVVTLPSGVVSNSTAGGGSLTQDLFHTGFDASWDIDLFGAVRRSIEAADLAASQEDLRGILVSLLAEVARNADLATGASHFWSIGPTLSWLIVDAGRIRANIAAQGAREEQQLSTSEQTVLTALEEVENALAAYGREQVRRARLADAVEANRRAVALSNELYLRGLGGFLNVLDSQRWLFPSPSDLA